METPSLTSPRNPGLDFVRALAIFLVLLSHCTDMFAAYAGVSSWPVISVSGFFGVELFFVLSGLLIGRLLLDILNRGFSGRAWMIFITRRWMRTLPLYYLWLIVLAIVWPPRFWEPDHLNILWRYLASYGALVQNFAWPSDGWFGVSWSLTVEEWFYLAFSGLLFVTARLFGPRRGLWLSLSVFLLVPTFLRWKAPIDVDFAEAISKVMILRLDAIAFGVALAVIESVLSISRRTAVVCLGAGLALLTALWLFTIGYGAIWLANHGFGTQAQHAFLFDICSLGVALCLPAAQRLRRAPSFVLLMSRYSYAIYIVHLSVLEILAYYGRRFGLPVFVEAPLALILIWVLAQASWRWLERPILAARPAQFPKSTTKTVVYTGARLEGT